MPMDRSSCPWSARSAVSSQQDRFQDQSPVSSRWKRRMVGAAIIAAALLILEWQIGLNKILNFILDIVAHLILIGMVVTVVSLIVQIWFPYIRNRVLLLLTIAIFWYIWRVGGY